MSHADEQMNEQSAGNLVYVRPVAAAEILDQIAESEVDISEDATLYAVHLEDGTRMAVFSERGAAFAAARSHGAEPVSVH